MRLVASRETTSWVHRFAVELAFEFGELDGALDDVLGDGVGDVVGDVREEAGLGELGDEGRVEAPRRRLRKPDQIRWIRLESGVAGLAQAYLRP
ncbi:MAG TPA: hypothetical protein VIP77_11385 [Jiangellaceae bacterium]